MKLDMMTRDELGALLAAAWDGAEEGLDWDGEPDKIYDLGNSVVEVFETPIGTVTAMSATLFDDKLQVLRP